MPLTSQPRPRGISCPIARPRASWCCGKTCRATAKRVERRVRIAPFNDCDQVVDHGGGFDPADIQTEFAQRVLLQLEFARSCHR